MARSGSLAGAARVLGVNHSTVFRRLNGFESSLSVRLFDRLADGYVLTTAGAEILDLAETIDQEFATLERKLAGRDFELSGRVRMTTAPNLAYHYLPGVLKEFATRYPQVRVEIAVSDTDYDLTRREADLALRATRDPPGQLVGRRVASLPWFACASPAYIRQNGKPETIGDLHQHDLIGADDRFARLTVFSWLRQEFSMQRVRYGCNDLSTMAALAEQDLGVAFLPLDMDRPNLTRLFAVCPEATGELWLLTHPDLRRVTRIRTLMRFLHERLVEDERLAEFVLPS